MKPKKPKTSTIRTTKAKASSFHRQKEIRECKLETKEKRERYRYATRKSRQQYNRDKKKKIRKE